jgi:hypothetical protein
MDIPFPVYLIGLRGLLNLVALILIGVSLLVNLRLLVQEPRPQQLRFFGFVTNLVMIALIFELIIRTLFMGGVIWLSALYGLMVAMIFWAVGGLKPEGWLVKSLRRPPERVGPYFFWASFVSLLLWWRYIETGIVRATGP